jgi:hypothetical protein
MPTKPLASQPCTCKDSFTLNAIDNEVKELLESCQKLKLKPNFPLKQTFENGLHTKFAFAALRLTCL